MAVEHQMATGSGPCERAHDVRHGRLGRDDTEGQLMRFQETGDVRCCQCRVTGWVRTLSTDEVAQKTDDLLAILVDPPHELFFQSMHDALVTLLLSVFVCVLSPKPLALALARWEREPGPYRRCPKVPYHATALAVGRTPAAAHGAVRRLHRLKRS